MSKNILISIGTLGLGGAEKQAVWLANCLSKNNEVILLTFFSGEREEDVSPRVTRLNLQLDSKLRNPAQSNSESLRKFFTFYVKKVLSKFLPSSLLNNFLVLWSIHKEITRKSPDVVITFLLHDTFLVGLATILRLRKPILIIGRRSPYGYGHLINGYFRKFLFSRINKKAKVCVTNSNANIASALIDGVKQEKIVNISNFIDKSNTAKQVKNQQEILKIVCVANMHWYKNHANLLRAFSRISDVNNFFELSLIGSGALLEENMSLSRQLNLNVNFLTSESKPRDILRHYNAFILVSNFEGSSNAMYEALAEGLPVISSDTGNSRELKDVGAPILLCDSESIDSIKNALLELLENYQKLESEAKYFSSIIQDMYSEERIFAKWDSLINSLFDK